MAVRSKHGNNVNLFRNLQAGSETSFTAIFNQYYAPLVLYTYRITDNQAAAEDIVGEAFISLWNKRTSIDEIHSLKAYLYTAARNRSLTWIRKNNRENERNKAALSFEEEFENTALENMIYAETMGKIYTAMDRLPPQCKKVFILHYIEGKKIAEIAEELKISISSVRTHRGRGIDLLQKALLSLLIWMYFLAGFGF
jgi:RNA polymerase sigma-70 factor (family 1)